MPLLKRLANTTDVSDEDDMESIALTIEITGNKPVLQDAVTLADHIERTRHNFDDMPD